MFNPRGRMGLRNFSWDLSIFIIATFCNNNNNKKIISNLKKKSKCKIEQ